MNDAVKYIKKCLKMGIAKDTINQQLKDAGWEDEVIQAAWQETRQSLKDKIWQALPRRKIFLIIPVVLILLLVGGYLAYAQFWASRPERIWSKALENTSLAQSWKSRGQITYIDKSASGEKFTLTAANEGWYRQTSQGVPDFELKSEAKIQAQMLDTGFSLESRKIGNTLFYKIGDVPFLSQFLGTGQPGEAAKAQWFKIDLDKKMEGQFSILDFMQTFQKDLKDLQKPFWQLKLLKPIKRLGEEKIEGTPAWRYEAQINKQEVQNYIETATKNLGSTKRFGELKTNLAEALKLILEKIDLKKVEIWIGKKDKRVYRILLETNAPSFTNAGQTEVPVARNGDYRKFIEALPFTAILRVESNFSNFDEPVTIGDPKGAVDYFEYLEKATKTALNAKAIADVRQIMTTLELYFNDQKRYPERLGLLNVTGGGKVEYIGVLPKPLVDPICEGLNEFFNYQASPDGKSYTFDFCLTTTTETLSAGRHQASGQGIR